MPLTTAMSSVNESTRQSRCTFTVKLSFPLVSRSNKQSNAQGGDADAGDTAQQRQDQAFGQQLPDQTKTPGSQAQPESDLAAPARRSRQQQIRDVETSDGQNQRDHRHQNPQRLGILPAQGIDARSALLKPEGGKVGAFADPLSRCSPQIRGRVQRVEPAPASA